MATVDLGAIRFNWKGAYAAGTAYVVDDVVSSGGSSYMCILAVTGTAPPNATYWSLMAQGGDVSTTISTQGDLLYRDGSGLQRLAKGTAGQVLTINSGATAPEWAALTPFDPAQLEMNMAILAFKVAAGDSLSKFQMVDQIIDDYADETGIDTTNSVNAGHIESTGTYAGRIPSTNYYGDSSDGALSTTANVTHTVQNKNGSYDGDMLVKNYTDLTINSGHTMTVDQPCRGMMIFVSGDCVINGTLSMKEKGPLANPSNSGGSDSNAVSTNGLQIGIETSGGSSSFTNANTNFNGCGTAARTAVGNFGNISSSGEIVTVVRAGGTGGNGGNSNSSSQGFPGVNGGTITNGTGGGGSGAGYTNPGDGSAGTCFSGGSGGGGAQSSTGGAATAFGGAGGAGTSAHTSCNNGGAGNPGGAHSDSSGYSEDSSTPAGGLGGLLFLFVKGTLSIGGSGVVTAAGGNGGGLVSTANSSYSGSYSSGGGAGGGGRAVVVYGGALSNSGSITAAGGLGVGVNTGLQSGPGGNGGAGVVSTINGLVLSGYSDMTLISTQTTHTAGSGAATPTSTDLVILVEDAAGTSVINTNVKAYVGQSATSTPVYTSAVTLVDEGLWGTNKRIFAARNIDTSALSGTKMNYKITTHSQSASMDTRIHSTSLAWA